MKIPIKKIVIIILLISSFIFWYGYTEPNIPKQTTIAIKVIDGDTIETDIGTIRLLGINTPEKNQPYYEEAKQNLKNLVEGKQIEVESTGKDKYQRTLAYIYLNNNLINKEQLSQGFANLYYYDKDNNYEKMKKAEEFARLNEKALWKTSQNSSCIKLIKLEYKDNGNCKNQEQLILQNSCEEISVIIKDDANHIYNEKIPNGIFTKNYSCIWNDAGDTVFIRDDSGLLLWHRYE